jgi:hypothetical protein
MINFLQQSALAEREQNRAPRFREIPDVQCVTPKTHGLLHELGMQALRRKETEAIAQLKYWRASKARHFTEQGRLDASARIILWERELEAIQNRIIAVLTAKP